MDEHDVVIPEGQQPLYDRFHYAPAVRVGDLVICSGVLGTGPDGKIVLDAEAQMIQAFVNLGRVLAAAGASFADVVELSSFHLDMKVEMGVFVRAKDRFIEAPYPAWTAVGVSGLAYPDARVEIKAIAHLPREPVN